MKYARKLWEAKYNEADGEGKGQRKVHQIIITGAILPIFKHLVDSLDGDRYAFPCSFKLSFIYGSFRIQIVRALCGGKRIVGVHVLQDYMKNLNINLRSLEADVRRNMAKQQLLDHLATNGTLADFFLLAPYN